MHALFRRIAATTSAAVGSPWAFLLAVVVIVVWGLTGPLFGFSDTWQLVVNTGTTIVTFLMVFLIQNTQNRDATAIHLKLDELLRAMTAARSDLIDLEDCTDEELAHYKREFERLRRQGRLAAASLAGDDEDATSADATVNPSTDDAHTPGIEASVGGRSRTG